MVEFQNIGNFTMQSKMQIILYMQLLKKLRNAIKLPVFNTDVY